MLKWFWLAPAIFLAACNGVTDSADHANLIHQLVSSTVQIVVSRDGGKKRNTGSGIVLEDDLAAGRMLVLTARHVVGEDSPEGKFVYVIGPNRSKRHPAKIVAISKNFDLAIIETGNLNLNATKLKRDAMLGDGVWVVAFPWGQRRTLAMGIVSQIDATPNPQVNDRFPISGAVRLVDAAVSFGASGGGVFDADTGDLIGIVRGYRTITVPMPGKNAKPVRLPVSGETTVVPASEIMTFLREAKLERLLPEDDQRQSEGMQESNTPKTVQPTSYARP